MRWSGGRRSRSTTGLAVATSLVLVASFLGIHIAGRSPAAAQPSAPNIVLIYTDDMRWDEMSTMPTVQSELIAKGMWFKQAFLVNPLCCPSRSTAMTGQYSHTTGVWTNSGTYGGFSAFRPHEGSTIATWLHADGYRTGLVGKYLNSYTAKSASHVPPGYDRWVAFVQPPNYYNYTLTIDGTTKSFGSTAADYSTDVLAGHATDFIRNAPTGQPLFLWFAPYAPHAPSTVAPRYANSLPNYVGTKEPNVAEADVSDKPAWVRALPAGKGANAWARKQQRQSLLAADDAIAGILQALNDTGRLNNTMILFAADNGMSGGSHRWSQKEAVWEETIRTPLVIRYDPITAGQPSTDQHLVTNLDYAPTFAQLAGVAAPGVQGMSLLPLLNQTNPPWRSEFLIDHLSTGGNPPTYCAVRTERYKYVEYRTHEEELYDLQADPYELESKHADPAFAAIKAQLHADLVSLCSPPPPGFTP